MKSTSCKEIAQEALALCLAGRPPRELPTELARDDCGDALFGILVEGLADRFEPSLCDAYARLFSQAAAGAAGLDAASLVERYERVRRVRPIAGDPRRVFLLSRVTLGADVAVTSVLIAAAKLRFPRADIVFVGPRKNYELFADDPRIRHEEIGYSRGGLRRRLAVFGELQGVLASPDSVTVDPDSRLTQLGLLPVCPEDRYYFFESRAYGRETGLSLPELAAAWASDTFGVSGAKPYVALPAAGRRGNRHIAVSLGVGDNPSKRLPDPFEEELLRLLAATGAPICIDKGAGGEEASRVERAVERSGARATYWEGSFAGFASIVADSRLYAGYDSAGQHVAAAAGAPLISIFAGFAAPRMFERWRPIGEYCRVIRVARPDVDATLAQVGEALHQLLK